MKRSGCYGCGVAIILTLFGAVAGIILGPALSSYETRGVTDAAINANPHDPNDMELLASFAATIMSVILGSLVGAALGLIIYLKDKAGSEVEKGELE